MPERATAVDVARSEDARPLAALAAAALARGWDESAFRSELARSDSHVWIVRGARGEGMARGGLVARVVHDELEVLWVAVAAGWRRRGLGRMLAERALALARVRGAASYLELRASNAAARALYAGVGFVEVGRRPRYYADGEDALLMRCASTAEPASEATARAASSGSPDEDSRKQ